eukprot:gene24606-10575_t
MSSWEFPYGAGLDHESVPPQILEILNENSEFTLSPHAVRNHVYNINRNSESTIEDTLEARSVNPGGDEAYVVSSEITDGHGFIIIGSDSGTQLLQDATTIGGPIMVGGSNTPTKKNTPPKKAARKQFLSFDTPPRKKNQA